MLRYMEGDAGPLYGRLAPVPNRKPDQIKKVFGGFTLEAFDSSESKVAPIVALRDENGKIRWSVYVDCYDEHLTRIRFTSYLPSPIMRPGRVRGYVEYPDGYSMPTIWFIESDGELKEYYFFT